MDTITIRADKATVSTHWTKKLEVELEVDSLRAMMSEVVDSSSLGDVVQALGVEQILEEIGEDAVRAHFKIREPEEE
jgi:hypothetical protein